MIKSIPDGVWPVMLTPYTEDDKIDYDGILEMLEWYAAGNVSGIFAVCQSSEMFFLSREERLELASFIMKNKPEGLGIIASGHVAPTLEEQIDEALAIIDTGVDSYVFITNQFAGQDESEDTAKKRIEALLEGIEADSFGIYECPHPYKRLMSPKLLSWCAQTGKFSFLKDTCCSLPELKAKLQAVEGTPLKIFNANAATLLESLKMGAAGYSGIMANFHADLYSWLCSNFEKDPKKASILQDLLGFASTIECQMYPVNAKYHMELDGLNINLFSRMQDFTKFTPNRQMEIEQMRRSVNLMRSQIGIWN
ncbi:MAG: dihydrodipicolinate synthase family protein [Spirochaetales bacterium]|nr:dihydrodipicolinate synthase family protein [Spirochaetales bacterium]